LRLQVEEYNDSYHSDNKEKEEQPFSFPKESFFCRHFDFPMVFLIILYYGEKGKKFCLSEPTSKIRIRQRNYFTLGNHEVRIP
jgi:hypothetical protein